jgi:hypothetical protein
MQLQKIPPSAAQFSRSEHCMLNNMEGRRENEERGVLELVCTENVDRLVQLMKSWDCFTADPMLATVQAQPDDARRGAWKCLPTPRPRGQFRCCNFCKKNGEPWQMYCSHNLRDEFGRVTCPVLYRYRCPWCGATGEYAHTASYCPSNPYHRSSALTSRTPRKSCGCLRTGRRHCCQKH